MSHTARIFTNGRSQAVRLPAAYRFNVKEVYIRQDAETGDVILSRRPSTWDDFLASVQVARAAMPADFLGTVERAHGEEARDPFDGWQE